MISYADCSVSPPPQAPDSRHSQHEGNDARVVSWLDENRQSFSSTLAAIVSLETTILALTIQQLYLLIFLKRSPLHVCRFDLMGLSPDSQEDDVGIKKAADNSEFI